jgi:MFS family permease
MGRRVNKFVAFAATVPISLSSGLTYSFSIWSEYLGTVYHLSAGNLALMAACSNVGGYSSIIAGLLYDHVARKHQVGPRIVLLIGLLLNGLGYGLLWAAATLRIHATFPQLLLLGFISCLGGTFLDTTAMTTNIRNFPAHRGTVVGILKTCVGLSAGVYGLIYSGFISPYAQHYLLFLAIAPAVASLPALLFLNHVPFLQAGELQENQQVFTTGGRFLFASHTLICLALFLMASALVQDEQELTQNVRAMLAVGGLVLIAPIVLLPYGSGGVFSWPVPSSGPHAEALIQCTTTISATPPRGNITTTGENENGNDSEETDDVRRPLLQDMDHDVSAPPDHSGDVSPDRLEAGIGGDDSDVIRSAMLTSSSSSSDDDDDDGARNITEEDGLILQVGAPDMTGKQCLSNTNFYLLAFTVFIGMGSCLAFLNNIARLVMSVGGLPNGTTSMLSIFSVSNAGGRMLFGWLPEKMLHAKGTPRPVFLVIASLLTLICCAGTAYFVQPRLLHPLAAGFGVSFGALWSLMPSLAGDFFGLGSFATIYTLLQVAPAAGSFGFASLLTGWLYEEELKRHGQPAGGVCIGIGCFKTAFMVMGIAGGLACIAAVVLTVRTKKVYRESYFALRKIDREMERHVVNAAAAGGGGGERQ